MPAYRARAQDCADVAQGQHFGRKPRPYDSELDEPGLHLCHIRFGQPHSSGTDVLCEVSAVCGARNRNDPRLACMQPRKRHLPRCRFVTLTDTPQGVDDWTVGTAALQR